MGAVTPFVFEGQSVRTLCGDDGQPWFVAADVCRCLEIGNSRMALDRLDDDEKGVSTTDTLGGPQKMATVNEPGLYRLIFTSRKDSSERFKRWLAHEVLPALRRDGVYVMAGPPQQGIEVDPDVERLWLSKVNLGLRVWGRRAARELWRMSPLPLPSERALEEAERSAGGSACLQWLLNWRLDGCTIGELVVASRVSEAACQSLAPLGVRVDVPSYDGFLVVADVHPVLMAIYANSPWKDGWRAALLAIPGAQATPHIRFRRVRIGAVAVPLHVTQ